MKTLKIPEKLYEKFNQYKKKRAEISVDKGEDVLTEEELVEELVERNLQKVVNKEKFTFRGIETSHMPPMVPAIIRSLPDLEMSELLISDKALINLKMLKSMSDTLANHDSDLVKPTFDEMMVEILAKWIDIDMPETREEESVVEKFLSRLEETGNEVEQAIEFATKEMLEDIDKFVENPLYLLVPHSLLFMAAKDTGSEMVLTKVIEAAGCCDCPQKDQCRAYENALELMKELKEEVGNANPDNETIN